MSFAETTIRNIQVEAQMENDKGRKAEIVKALDYEAFRQEGYTAERIKTRYPTTHGDVLPFMATIPLTGSMVRQLAKMFESDPVISLAGIDEGAIYDEFIGLLDRSQLYIMLGEIDRLCETCHQVGVLPHYDETIDKVFLQLVTPDKVTVWQNAHNPQRLDALAYPLAARQNTAIAQRGDIYAYWTADEYKEVNILTNGEIEAIPGTQRPNLYGRIPVIWFSNTMPRDSFWIDRGFPIVTANETANLQLTAFNMGVDFQSFSTMVIEGFRDSKTATSNISRFLNIPPDGAGGALGKAYFINPGVNLSQIWEVINEAISLTASLLGISADMVKGGASYNSGYQLRLSMEGVISHNKSKRKLYAEPMRYLVQLMMDCKRIYGKKNLPQDADIMIDFADIQVTPNPLEVVQIRTIRLANGEMSIIDAIMEDNQDLTREQATERKAQIDSEMSSAGKTPNLAEGMFQ